VTDQPKNAGFKIYKYPLAYDPDSKLWTADVPDGPLRKVGLQGGVLTAWVEVYVDSKATPRRFITLPTGADVPDNYGYVDTLFDGVLVWHVYEVFEDSPYEEDGYTH
jgi:hypothetical protein